MKKFYHTLAIAAIAAVSMFSAQSAKAQFIRSTSSAAVILGVEEDEPELASSANDLISESIYKFCKECFEDKLEYYKAHNTLVTKLELKKLLEEGKKYGISATEVMSYLTNIAPY